MMMKVARGNAPGIYLFDGNTSDQIINGAATYIVLQSFVIIISYGWLKVAFSPFPSEKPDFPEPAMVSNVPFE